MGRCSPDDSFSEIFKSKPQIEIRVGLLRAFDSSKFEIVTTLRRGDLPFDLQLKIDESRGQRRHVRFIHK